MLFSIIFHTIICVVLWMLWTQSVYAKNSILENWKYVNSTLIWKCERIRLKHILFFCSFSHRRLNQIDAPYLEWKSSLIYPSEQENPLRRTYRLKALVNAMERFEWNWATLVEALCPLVFSIATTRSIRLRLSHW